MEKLAILSEALEQMGFDLSGLTFDEVVSMQSDIENVIDGYVNEPA